MVVLIGVLAIVLLGCSRLCAEVAVLSPQEEANWRRELLPLPQELSVGQIRRLRPGDVTIRGRPGSGGLEQKAVAAVVELYARKTGVPPAGKGFEILIGVMDEEGRIEGIAVPQGSRLKGAPNRDQAYVIQPEGANRLLVAALADRGLYYGTRTLSQWLESHLSSEAVELPLARVVDWPDLEERGFWHMPVSLVPWLASMKMNRFYVSHQFTVDDSGIHPHSSYNEAGSGPGPEWTPPYEGARQYAAEVVPGPTHMDFWEGRCPGYRDAYPHLIGKGEAAKNPFRFEETRQRVPCATHPDLVKILTAVMTELAAREAGEVMVWMSEFPAAHCECETCMEAGQFRAETRAALEAWGEAKKAYPDLRLSVFFGSGGFSRLSRPPSSTRYPDQQIRDITAALPQEVTMRPSGGCDGPDGRLMAGFAARGKRIARCNVVSLSPAFQSDDIRRRMEAICADGYIGAWQFTPGGYADADRCRRMYDYRACALAEYSWNAKGRNAREFTEAWACRQGIESPEGFVAWVEAMDMPSASRLSGCWPYILSASWLGRLEIAVAERKWDEALLKPGEPEAGIAQCARALALAEQLGRRDLAADSRLLLAYCRLEQAAYRFVSRLADAESQGEAVRAFGELKESLNAYVQARLEDAADLMADSVVEAMKKQGRELKRRLDAVAAAGGIGGGG